MAWITTQTKKQLIVQKENRLKGLGLQSFVSHLIKNKYNAESLIGDEDTVKQIKEKSQSAMSNIYIAKKTFKVSGANGNSKKYFGKNSSNYDHENHLVDLNEFKEPLTLSTKIDTCGSELGYIGCKNCYFAIPEKFCKICGGAIFEDKDKILGKIDEKYDGDKASDIFFNYYPQKTLKYPDTNRGKFRANVKWIKESNWNKGVISNKIKKYQYSNGDFICSGENHKAVIEENNHLGSGSPCPVNDCYGSLKKIRPGLTVNEFEVEKKDCSLDEIENYFEKNSLVTKDSVGSSFSNSRLDSWLISKDNNEIYIVESKNYEKTPLSSTDLYQILRYVQAIIESGVAKPSRADLIYNGVATSGLKEFIEVFEESIDTNINLIHVKEFCIDLSIFPKKIVIGKNLESCKRDLGKYSVDWAVTDSMVEQPRLVILDE